MEYDKIYNSYYKEKKHYKTYYARDNKIDIQLSEKCPLVGNIMIYFRHIDWLGGINEIFRYTFNTSYIPDDNMIVVDRWHLSPESA